MPEKAAIFSKDTSWVFHFNPTIHWSFKVLSFVVFVGILVVWGIDGWDAGSFHKDFLAIKLNSTQNNLKPTHVNLGQYNVSVKSNSTVLEKVIQTHENSTSKFAPVPLIDTQNQLNVTKFSPQDAPISAQASKLGYSKWISGELEPDYTSRLLSAWLAPGGEQCRDSETVEITIPELDGHDHIELSTGEIHEFVFHALDESGKPRCFGGDYFETDISGELWKSRPIIKDLGNGTYVCSLQVHPDFPGDYNFTIIFLFRRYQGLKNSPERFSVDKVLRKIPIKFVKSSIHLPELKQCQKSDFTRDIWSGRWTRHTNNESCSISNDGRYRCQDPNFPCHDPWCYGSLGSLESNGWTYSTHCSFKLFSSETAWNCLNNRWIFFWGDSNHCDTIRNILNFILNVDIKAVPRLFDMNITNPKDPAQTVRITSIFNGNANATGNYQGLNSLYNEAYRELLKQYFSQQTVPDTVIMNSGLHDGVFWPTIRRFAKGAQDAAHFWSEVMEGVKQRGLAVPEIIFRSTIATGGYARRLAFNPSKMEAFNGMLLEKLRQFGLVTSVIDDFDLTYPWHFDNRCSDGVHYGRAPVKMLWRDGQIGHQYFVDLMLCHVILNAICSN